MWRAKTRAGRTTVGFVIGIAVIWIVLITALGIGAYLLGK